MAYGQDRNFGSIEDFLASLGLQEYLPLMESEGIELDSLTEMSEDDFLKIGIEKMGHRKKILKEVKMTLLTEISGIENTSSEFEESLTSSSENVSPVNENQPPERLDNEIRIAIVGKTGSGKSATANTILGKEIFPSKPMLKSVTSKCAAAHQVRFGKKIVIADTPGVCDAGREEEDVQEEIKKCLLITAPGPHAFILVIGNTRYTKEENDAVQHFIKYFGEGIYEYFIVLFTRKDELNRANMSLKDFIKDAPEELKEFISKCQERVIAFDNTLKGNEQGKQVKELLDMINANGLRNSGKYYTHEMYQKAEQIMKKGLEDIKESEKEAMDEIRRKLQEENEKEFQIALRQKESEIKEIEKKKREHLESSYKNENKEILKSLEQKCKELEEEKDKLRKQYDEKDNENQNNLQARIDAKCRDRCRKEVQTFGSELLARLTPLLIVILYKSITSEHRGDMGLQGKFLSHTLHESK